MSRRANTPGVVVADIALRLAARTFAGDQLVRLLPEIGRSGRARIVRGRPGDLTGALADVLVERARDLGIPVSETTCHWLGAEVPWSAATDLLDARRDGLSTDDVASALDVLTARLERWCVAGPRVIVLRDAEWCDPFSLRWIVWLAQRISGLPVLLLVALGRSSDAANAAGVEAAAEVLVPDDPTPDQLAEVFVEHGVNLDARCSERLVEIAAGDARLAAAAVAALIGKARDIDVGDLGALVAQPPRQVVDEVRRRLIGLDPTSIDLLRAAAVLGEDADLPRLAAVADLSIPTVERLRSSLRTVGLLHGSEIESELVANAVLAETPTEAAVALHRRAAGVLMDLADRERVVRHLLLAEAGGDPAAAQLLIGSAADLMAAGRPDRAIERLRRALLESDGPLRAQCHLLLGRAHRLIGSSEAIAGVRRLFEDSSGHYRDDAAEELAALLGFQGHATEALEVLDGVTADRLDGNAQRLRAIRAAYALTDDRTAASGMPQLADLVAAPNPTAESLATMAAAHVLHGTATGAIVRDLARRACALGGLVGSQESPSLVWGWACRALLWVNDTDAAAQLAADAEAAHATQGWLLGRLTAATWRARIALWVGDLAAARLAAEESIRLGAESATTRSYGEEFSFGVQLMLAAEQPDLAAGWFPAGIGAFATMPFDTTTTAAMVHEGCCRWWTARGDVERAARHADALSDAASRRGGWPLGSRVVVADARRLGGAEAEARRLLEEELAVARAWGEPSHLGVALNALARLSRGIESLARYAEAAELLSSGPRRLVYARALTDHGGVLRRSGQRRQARDVLRQAAGIAERCGAAPLSARIAEELLLAGGRAERPFSGSSALTPAERRAVLLAADGVPNREIAQQLFISIKTVETHLSRAFAKLGVHNRRALASIDLSSLRGAD
ncbi:MAG: LuxR C-terminal-related transcriptional regulator [Mycobacteriales bacterium]